MPKKETRAAESSPTALVVGCEAQSINPPGFHRYYVGLDIGYKFHVMAIIPTGAFLDPKERWKKAKTVKFNSDAEGIATMLQALEAASSTPAEFSIVMEPTGGHYGYIVMQVLLRKGYHLQQVENRAVKKHREDSLGISEKSDQIDSRVVAQMAFQRVAMPGTVAYVRPMTPLATHLGLFRNLVRDRWLLNTQLTRRKNQVQQFFAVTNPNLKSVFALPSRVTVMKLVLKYPTAAGVAKATEEDLRQALLEAGAKVVARKAAAKLKELNSELIQADVSHVINRQTWLIHDALRLHESIQELDAEIHGLLWGDPGKGTSRHTYTDLLFSLPVMSDTWAATLIGVIGDASRFDNARQFTKYLGFSPKGEKSGISVDRRKMDLSGVRDSRRVLFQMALVLVGPKSHNVFKAYFERRVAQGMPKMRALGHLCGKVSHVIFAMLRDEVHYDARSHAAAVGVEWDDSFSRRSRSADPSAYESEADAMATGDESEDPATAAAIQEPET